MSLESAVASRNTFLTQYGKRVLNIKYPDEFELYVIALELTDETFKTLRYFVFPVNPSMMEESKPEITNIKKTLGGVTVLANQTFVPTDINISGSFGRNFKVLLGSTYEDFISSFKDYSISGNFDVKQVSVKSSVTASSLKRGITEVFDERVKTGYGCTKILEDIISESKVIDNGKIRHLIFHNPALGNSYLVRALNSKYSMSEQTNMIWNYSLQLKTVAPIEMIFNATQLKQKEKDLAVTGYMQGKVNELIHGLGNIVGNGINRFI